MTRRRTGKRRRTSPNPAAKRCRGPLELESGEMEAPPAQMLAPSVAPQPLLVMVAGLPPGCGVIELKSRMGTYGPIARIRIDDATATGYVTFRSAAAAMDAIAASLDPGCGITIGSKKVLVVQASGAPSNSKVVIRADQAKSTSHGLTEENYGHAPPILSSRAAPEGIHKARETVAYDDLF